MAQTEGMHPAVLKKLLDLPGPRDEMLSQDLHQIMEGGLVNSMKLKNFLEAAQQQESQAFNATNSQMDALSFARSAQGFDTSMMTQDLQPRRCIFDACADRFTSKSVARQPIPRAMAPPSAQELGLNTRKPRLGSKEERLQRSSSSVLAATGVTALPKSSSSGRRMNLPSRQLMQRKSRNELLYQLKRQLTDYTHQCNVETKRRMVAQNANNWNERPYVALQLRAEDPDAGRDVDGGPLLDVGQGSLVGLQA